MVLKLTVMKTFKYILVLTFILLSTLSCTEDEDEGVDIWVAIDYLFNGSNDYTTQGDTTPVKTYYTFFNPPNWIQGEWINIDPSSKVECIEFTPNNVLTDTSYPGCQKGTMNGVLNNGVWSLEYEIVNDSIYEFALKSQIMRSEYKFKLDNSVRLHFEKRYGRISDWKNADLKENTFRKK